MKNIVVILQVSIFSCFSIVSINGMQGAYFKYFGNGFSEIKEKLLLASCDGVNAENALKNMLMVARVNKPFWDISRREDFQRLVLERLWNDGHLRRKKPNKRQRRKKRSSQKFQKLHLASNIPTLELAALIKLGLPQLKLDNRIKNLLKKFRETHYDSILSSNVSQTTADFAILFNNKQYHAACYVMKKAGYSKRYGYDLTVDVLRKNRDCLLLTLAYIEAWS